MQKMYFEVRKRQTVRSNLRKSLNLLGSQLLRGSLMYVIKFELLLLVCVLEVSLVVLWLRLQVPHAGDPGSIPGKGAES